MVINKTIFHLLSLLFCMLIFSGQSYSQTKPVQKLLSGKIEIPSGKTIHINFDEDARLIYKDIGSDLVLLDEQPGLLRLAAKNSFEETNLTFKLLKDHTVYYYSYILTYRENPAVLNYFISDGDAIHKQVTTNIGTPEKKATISSEAAPIGLPTSEMDTTSEYYSTCKQLLRRKTKLLSGLIHSRLTFQLQGLYIDQDRLYFVIETTNTSNIPYDIDYFKFTVRIRSSFRKSASQEEELRPVYVYNDPIRRIPPAGGSLTKVFVFNKFTITTDKKLLIELGERNGDRNLLLTLGGNIILSAQAVN